MATPENTTPPAHPTALTRTAFTTDRRMEFFTESELTAQIGYGKRLWPLVLTKELIDNELDACESIEVIPQIAVRLERDAITVAGNGSGLKPEIIERALDYRVRISDKKYYIAPTRGQLGNALKCLWPASFVANGEQGIVEIMSCGWHHRIEVRLDRIANTPDIGHIQTLCQVKNGTSVKMHWPEIACLEPEDGYADFYQAPTVADALSDLVADFSAFNPHAVFEYTNPDGKLLRFPVSNPEWLKWRTSDPTSAHWYSVQNLGALIAAYVREGNGIKLIRDFVSEFDGLSGTQYRKRVIAEAEMYMYHLNDLVADGDIDVNAVRRLLAAMQRASRPVKPERFGVIGKEYLEAVLVKRGAAPDSVTYRKVSGVREDGLPYLGEVAFGVMGNGQRRLLWGLNYSPVFKVPSDELNDILTDCHLQPPDPVILLVHQSQPQFLFTDHGKGAIVSNGSGKLQYELARACTSVTKAFVRAKRQAANDRLTPNQIERLRKEERKEVIKSAAYQIMPEAYRLASSDGTLPANARQIMYAARPLVLEVTDGTCWRNTDYFTQTLLPDYMAEHPEETAKWDVVYDARGHFVEPHVRTRLGLGTLDVRRYIASWSEDYRAAKGIHIDELFPTHGPKNRYRFAMFIEKEGFDQLLERSQMASRYDLAIFSSKGMSVVAARVLVDALSQRGVTIFVAHDFDIPGLSIAHTLGHDSDRYRFKCEPNVIDLGMRLADVEAMQLQSEPVDFQQNKHPGDKLRDRGIPEHEINYLVDHRYNLSWRGKRVELNAMTSAQFIQWLEGKLDEHGVTKIVPDEKTLKAAWIRANWLVQAEAAIAAIETDDAPMPPDLAKRVRKLLEGESALSWDQAVVRFAREGASN